jgi:hypothetical protein
MDSTIFYIALFFHLAFLIVGFGSVLVIDTFGLMWLLKRKKLSEVTQTANLTQILIWIGWCGMIASGAVLIYLKGYVDNLTKIKLFFVLMVGFNGIYLHHIKKAMAKISDSEKLPTLLLFRITLATIISQVGWWGAILIGFIHRHIAHDIPLPSNPYTYIFIISGIFLGAAAAGELAFRNQNQQITKQVESKA